jgi:hypothetical protein
MLEAREREPEVIEPVLERLTRDRDSERARVGEVGKAQAARLVLRKPCNTARRFCVPTFS